jgi:hypothetical protein
MFNGATLNGDIDWSGADLSASTASKTNTFQNTVWNGHYILVQNSASRTFLITNSSLSDVSRIKVRGASSVLKPELSSNVPTIFLGIPSPFRARITKITFQNTLPVCNNPFDVSSDGKFGVLACVENSTEIVVGADGGVVANPDSSYLFFGVGASAGGAEINLTNLNTDSAINMTGLFYDSILKSTPVWAAGFGSTSVDMKGAFLSTTLPSGFTLPQGFGSQASDMEHMFENASLPANFVFPAGFGAVATDMNRMFTGATLNGDIDWSGTDLPASVVSKTNMFARTVWNNHVIYVLNAASRTFLITDSSLSDVSRIKVKGVSLKSESANPASFLGLNSPTRAQITKITFQNTLPICPEPFDVSSDGKSGVLACVNNSTEIVIGADGAVQANFNSSWLFSNLSASAGVEINLTNLNTSPITNMTSLFANSILKSTPVWTSDFGTTDVDMTSMFSAAVLPSGFLLPTSFGGAATNMNSMFSNTTLNSDIDWSDTDFTASTASKSDMFAHTVWNNHVIYVLNASSQAFLITDTGGNIDNIKVKMSADNVLKAEVENPTTFFGIPSPTRAEVIRILFNNSIPRCENPIDVSANGKGGVILCVNTDGNAITIGADGGVVANPDSSYLFANLTLPRRLAIDFTYLDASKVTNMKGMFYNSKITTNPVWFNDDFGKSALSTAKMFQNATLSAGWTLPDMFGLAAVDMSSMFQGATFSSYFIFDGGFGQKAVNMSNMFNSAILNSNIKWADTDFAGKTDVNKTNMFTNTVWNSHALYVGNAGSQTFFTDGTSATRSNIKMLSNFLKREEEDPSLFLGIPTLFRSDITKISFKNTFPSCDNQIDVSADGKRDVLLCVNNNEVVIGADGEVVANDDSSWLFANLANSSGVEFDLTDLDEDLAHNMTSMFENTKIKTGFVWSVEFGKNAINMNDMFFNSQVITTSESFVLEFPAGFGMKAQNMSHMFQNTYFSLHTNFPNNFGSSAVDMSYMFSNGKFLPDVVSFFSLPDNFGAMADDISYIFYNFSLPYLSSSYKLPTEFGKVATNMNSAFRNSSIRDNLDWLGANFAGRIATKDKMFLDFTWKDHVIYVSNADSQTFLTDNTGATNANIVVKP